MMISDMLSALGHRMIAEAGSVDDALPLATSADFELAILDVNFNGAKITPVAALIKERNCPIIFATGYGFAGLPEESATILRCKSLFRSRPSQRRSTTYGSIQVS
jgi:CheY-like chemotaxis protein